MPAKKDKDEEARHSDNPTLDELKARATPKADPEHSGHPSPDDAPKETRAAAADEQPAPEPAPVPEAPKRTIEQLLADPTFDREGKVRSKLAAYSARHGIGQEPPADLVDERGTPI